LAAGDSFAERTGLCRQNSLSPVEKFIGGVVDTSEQFIAGVIDTGEQFDTPQRNPCHRFSLIGGVVDTGNNIFSRCR
jgi:hypothetical protein